MNRNSTRPWAVTVAASALALGTATAPGLATPYPGPPVPRVVELSEQDAAPDRCPLERVGTQFVRCDDLTGNGVAAPSWVRQA